MTDTPDYYLLTQKDSANRSSWGNTLEMNYINTQLKKEY